MTAYRVERDRWGSHEVAVLHDDARDRRVRIARRGATVLDIEVMHRGRKMTLTDGYRDAAELEGHVSSRSAVMVPFANRIADARYAFDGATHDLQPGSAGAARGVKHGYVRGTDFELAELVADAHGARVVFTAALRADAHPGYPFALELEVRYVLDATGLALEATMRNVGPTAAPCFFGWHPYFRFDDTPMEGLQLQIPAATLIHTDADYISLPGAAAYASMDDAPALDFRTPRAIGATELNHAYADLARDADGRMRTRLRDPASGLALAVWQERGVMLTFTADTVARDVRRSIALEPMESMADAFNRPDCADAIRLEPGAERRYRCGVEIETA